VLSYTNCIGVLTYFSNNNLKKNIKYYKKTVATHFCRPKNIRIGPMHSAALGRTIIASREAITKNGIGKGKVGNRRLSSSS